MKENRKLPRFGPLVIKASIADANGVGRRNGYLTNVSKSGAFLAIDAPPVKGEELLLLATLPWRLGELSARVRVAWRRSEPDDAGPITGAGLEFVELKGDSASLLDDYLQKFLELAASLEAEA